MRPEIMLKRKNGRRLKRKVIDPPREIVVGMEFVMAMCPDIMGASFIGVN
jgi:hypothetical protein